MEEFAIDSLLVRTTFGLLTAAVSFLIGAAWLRARRVSRAELRTFKELSRESGLRYRPPFLFRAATLAGNWRNRAMIASLGLDALYVVLKIGGNNTGRAVVKFPVERRSPVWGISAQMESTYHLNGEIAIIRRLSEAQHLLEKIRELIGEFSLSVRLKNSPRKKKGRLLLKTSIAIGSQEHLVRLLDALELLARFLEEEKS